MNIVFAKHGMIGPAYCFEVPDQMVKHIKVGTELYVDTMQGASMATATTGVVTGDGAEDVARQNGAYFPLKQVLSFLNKDMIRYVENSLMRRIRDVLTVEEIPF